MLKASFFVYKMLKLKSLFFLFFSLFPLLDLCIIILKYKNYESNGSAVKCFRLKKYDSRIIKK